MLPDQWRKLQNGSDIRGIALEGSDGQTVNLTPAVAREIAAAFGIWLSQTKNKPVTALKIAVGNDSRLSAAVLREAIVAGLTSLGCEVFHCGLASTPAMFMTTVTPGYMYDGAIMITASHLPFNRNGMKFFTAQGGLEKQDITAILSLAAQGAEPRGLPGAAAPGKVVDIDFISVYADLLVQKIRRGVNDPGDWERPLRGFKIVVDAGNGAGGFFVAKVLRPLGAATEGSQFLEPDGTFPNHIPNPEDEAAMRAICNAVTAHQADLGIIFDTDVDRASAVAHNGKEINRNRIIALMAAIVLAEHPGSAIVTDSITSSGLKTFIEDRLGGVHHRFKRGYKNVINEAVRLNNAGTECHLAIETSGHGALGENYFLDDGAYLIAKILIQMAKMRLAGQGGVGSLIETLEEPLESKEFRLNILTEDFKSYGAKVLEGLRQYAVALPGWQVEPNNYEGIRVACDQDHGDGWFLLRLSLHDPLLPLNIESNAPGGVGTIVRAVLPFLKQYDQLDIEGMNGWISGK